MAYLSPHPVDRMTDACENIIFPQLLLRAVKMLKIQSKDSRTLQFAALPLRTSISVEMDATTSLC